MRPHDTPEIKRRPDGSIDTAHYMRTAAEERSRRAHDMAEEVLADRDRLSALLRNLHRLLNLPRGQSTRHSA